MELETPAAIGCLPVVWGVFGYEQGEAGSAYKQAAPAFVFANLLLRGLTDAGSARKGPSLKPSREQQVP